MLPVSLSPATPVYPHSFSLGHGRSYTFLSLVSSSLSISLHLSCKDYNSQRALLLPPSRAGWECRALQRDFPLIGKGRKNEAGAS